MAIASATMVRVRVRVRVSSIKRSTLWADRISVGIPWLFLGLRITLMVVFRDLKASSTRSLWRKMMEYVKLSSLIPYSSLDSDSW